MIKLCEEGYIMSISDYPIYQKIPFDAPDDYRYPYINLDVFFKNKSSKNKFDILMYDNQNLTNQPYEQRLNMLPKLSNYYFKPTAIFTDNFAEHADQIISAG